LAVVFKKKEISQQVVTRMQDLASEFSKIFPGWYPRNFTAREGDLLPHPTPSRRGASAPVLGVGPKPWSPQHFSRGCAPGSVSSGVLALIPLDLRVSSSRQHRRFYERKKW